MLGTLGLGILVIGIGAIGFTAAGCEESLGGSLASRRQDDALAALQEPMYSLECPPAAPEQRGGSVRLSKQVPQRRRMLGVMLAVLAGASAGTSHAVFRMAPEVPFRDGVRALSFVVDHGVSAGAISTILLAIRIGAAGVRLPPMHARTCFAPAALSGLLWNLGFMGVTLALVPTWGLQVGGPSTQACILVSGLWGVFAFREVRHPLAFFAASLVVLGGVTLLGVYGRSPLASEASGEV